MGRLGEGLEEGLNRILDSMVATCIAGVVVVCVLLAGAVSSVSIARSGHVVAGVVLGLIVLVCSLVAWTFGEAVYAVRGKS
jgi:hypothetical protein